MHAAPADFTFGGEPLAVSLGSGAAQHGVEVNERLGVRAFPDNARPHRVVKGRGLMFRGAHSGCPFQRFLRNGSASGLPGPKCFRITSGSVLLGFSMRTPSFAAAAVTNSSSSVS